MKIKRSFSLDLSLPVLVLIGISAWAWGLEATATFVAWGLFLFLALATLVLGFVLSAGKNVQVAVAFGRFVAATPRVEIPSLQAHPVVRAARFTALLASLAYPWVSEDNPCSFWPSSPFSWRSCPCPCSSGTST